MWRKQDNQHIQVVRKVVSWVEAGIYTIAIHSFDLGKVVEHEKQYEFENAMYAKAIWNWF